MNLQSNNNYVGPVSRLKEGKGQALLVMTLCFMFAVFYSEYWLQNLVSFCSKKFKEINLKPWLHSFLHAGAYLPVCKLILLMTSLFGNLGSRWVG